MLLTLGILVGTSVLFILAFFFWVGKIIKEECAGEGDSPRSVYASIMAIFIMLIVSYIIAISAIAFGVLEVSYLTASLLYGIASVLGIFGRFLASTDFWDEARRVWKTPPRNSNTTPPMC